MRSFLLPGRNGYVIAAQSSVQDEHKSILLCLRGFGGGRRSPVVEALTEALEADGIGVVTFPWPGHGDSPAEGSDLTVENCLSDLDTILEYIHETWPQPVSCFATSYGGYLAALYRSEHPAAFEKLVLRSPALCMPQTFIGFFSEKEKERFLAGEPVNMGISERPMELTVRFYDSLKAHDAFHAVVPAPEQVLILQGDRDDVVLPEDTAAYAEKNELPVTWFHGSDHSYRNPGDIEKIVAETRSFLLGGA